MKNAQPAPTGPEADSQIPDWMVRQLAVYEQQKIRNFPVYVDGELYCRATTVREAREVILPELFDCYGSRGQEISLG